MWCVVLTAASMTISQSPSRSKNCSHASAHLPVEVLVRRASVTKSVISATKLPLILGNPGAEVVDLEYLATERVRICLQGHAPAMAAIQAVYDTLKALREGAPPADLKGLPSNALIKRVTRADHYERSAADFLSGTYK